MGYPLFALDKYCLCVYNSCDAEGWPSGRRRATRNRLSGDESLRGFKSHPLRHIKNNRPIGRFYFANLTTVTP